MTDKRKLKAAIYLAGETQGTLAEKLGLSRPGFSKKMNGGSDFRANEIERIAKILDLTPEGIAGIFFASEVDKMATEKEAVTK